ncbi:zeta toxin family protein [Bowmanella denitrificans]|uniref:Zeta toxin family protein n=1 Tax=Bowmanella denitrificans TaxID=366582 RepID=A0ABP3GDQ5_9ALTE
MPRLRLIAGPNGSGKTTLTNELRQKYDVPLGQYVNPDEIELTLHEYEPDPLKRSKLAQKIATEQRQMWLTSGVSHSYESVMSHASHLDYIQEANRRGYKSYLYYVCIADPDINVERVDERVALGGHPVPKEKIRSRYSRSLSQLFDMARQCHRVYFFDNTDMLVPIAEVNPNSFLDVKEEAYNRVKPKWFRESVLLKWDKQKVRILR